MGDDEQMVGMGGGLTPGAQMSPAQQAHAQHMSAFMSALDSQRDRQAMAQIRTQGMQPGTTMMAGGAGAAGSMARAGMIGPGAMLQSAMRHPPRMAPMHAQMKKPAAPMPQASSMSAGQKAGAFLSALDVMKTAQRLGQGEHPKGPPQGAAVGGMAPGIS